MVCGTQYERVFLPTYSVQCRPHSHVQAAVGARQNVALPAGTDHDDATSVEMRSEARRLSSSVDWGLLTSCYFQEFF